MELFSLTYNLANKVLKINPRIALKYMPPTASHNPQNVYNVTACERLLVR